MEFEQITIILLVPGYSQVLAPSVFTGSFPGLDGETTFAEDFFNFPLKEFDIWDGAGSNSSVVYVRIFQDGLEYNRLKNGWRILNVCKSCSRVGTGSVVSGSAVFEGNGSVAVEYPGRVEGGGEEGERRRR